MKRRLFLVCLFLAAALPARAGTADVQGAAAATAAPDTGSVLPVAPQTTATVAAPYTAEPVAAPSGAETSGAAEMDARKAELDAVNKDMALTADHQAELKGQIESLGKDRAALSQSLIETNEQVQKLEGDIDAAETRLKVFYAQEANLRASLASRRDVLADVLAALQRMGRKPPPAILVRPEDALASVRSAILLGAIVPDLRDQAAAVARDLDQLVAIRSAKEKELDDLRTNASALAEGRARIAMLVDQRQSQLQASSEALTEEEKRSAALAGQSTSLHDLIARMEQQNAIAAAAAAEAKQATEDAEAASLNQPPQHSLGNADRLKPKVAFAEARGLLPMPAVGTQVSGFGADDGLGGRTQGISLSTHDGAVVSSPSDGWVVYAGPFRSYGQLLIINAGGGYHVLLAGMERIDVALGQFVLAGEPVAVMPSRKLASTEAAVAGAAPPVLYIEFRKDGASIDPAPWWAASNAEKAGG